jgi:hypothetical protein
MHAMANFSPLNLSCLGLGAPELSSLQLLATVKNQARDINPPRRPGVAKARRASAVIPTQFGTLNVSCLRLDAGQCSSLQAHLAAVKNQPRSVKTPKLCYFIIRKVLSSAKMKKKAAAAMSALLRYCVRNKYISGEKVADELKRVDDIGSFDGDGLVDILQSLYNTGYWDQLRRQRVEDANSTGNSDDEDEGSAGDEGGMIITEVRKDGWMMARDIARFTGDADPNDPDMFFVHLPPDVAARGRVDVRFSCMALVLRRGIWSPQGEEHVCANAYPPSGF